MLPLSQYILNYMLPNTYTYTYTYMYMCIYIYSYSYRPTDIRIHICIYIYLCICISIFIYIYTNTFRYTYLRPGINAGHVTLLISYLHVCSYRYQPTSSCLTSTRGPRDMPEDVLKALRQRRIWESRWLRPRRCKGLQGFLLCPQGMSQSSGLLF